MKIFQVVNNSVTYVPADKFSHDQEETLPDIIEDKYLSLFHHKVKD